MPFSWLRYFCRTALRLWIIDFPPPHLHPRRHLKERKQRHEQPFFAAFRDFPAATPPSRSFAYSRVCWSSSELASELKFCGGWREGGHTCVYMIFLRYASPPSAFCCHCCCCCFMYEHYSYEFMKKIRFGFLCTLWFSSFRTARTGEKFLNLRRFFSRPSLDPLPTHPPQPLDRNLNFRKYLPSRSGQFLEK